VPVLGGSPRRILSDIIDAAWSPDGTELAVARDIESGVTYQMQLCDTDGNCETIYEVGTRSGYGLAWSPNGKYLSTALVAPLLNHPTQDILVLDAATGEEFRKFRIPFSIGPPAWSLDGENILVARSTTLLGDLADPHGQILSYNLLSQMPKTLLHLGATTTNGGIGVVLAVESENSFYFDEIELQSALHTVSIPASADKDGQVLLSSIRLDRQPAFSPDGTKIIFSSNRSLNLDLWMFDRTTGELIQITDDEAQDWDPAFTPDGNGILWSSNRSGQLEIWKANVDGTNAEQVSNDGVDAENPTQGAGRWVAYGSGNPANPGVWLIDPETKETRHLVEGIVGMPDMSPDGKHVFCLEISNAELKSIIRIADVETGEIVLKTDVLATNSVSGTTTGRGRWMPDGKSFVFVMREPEGLSLISQEFRPGENTDATRKRLVGPTTETEIESFCIHPDGQEIVTANRSARMVIKHAQNVQ
ncbi:MAG: hypothetical protein HKN21_09740, partial [Candidatus Eisenbacteria bacterium]|nr:hypothetical protein [Candidatus Eisenbacteria bacterium]